MKFRNIAISFAIVGIVGGCASHASSIAGVWKHTQKPAWIGIQFDDGVGSAWIARHDENEDALGLGLLSRIEADEVNPNLWRAEIYSAEDDGYIAAVLVLGLDGVLVISTVDEGVEPTEVLRLMREPEF